MDNEKIVCPVCRTACSQFDVVDLSKSCNGRGDNHVGLAGVPIRYVVCDECGFCFAPEMHKWPLKKFEELIYNDEYVQVDPDYLDNRPRANAGSLRAAFPSLPDAVRHLDYGGGNGLLAKLLRESNWNSASYDPFINRDTSPEQLGKFDLITVFEVFEHVPDVQGLMSDLRSLLSSEGLVIFSTLLSDGNIRPNERLNWWYAAPRNGHISLFSRKSLTILAHESGFDFGSFSDGVHVFFRDVPKWASHIIRIG